MMDLWDILTDVAGLTIAAGVFYRLGLIHADLTGLKDRVAGLEVWRDGFGFIPKL